MAKKRNNSAWCCDMLEEKLNDYNKQLKELQSVSLPTDLTIGQIMVLEKIINDINTILYN